MSDVRCVIQNQSGHSIQLEGYSPLENGSERAYSLPSDPPTVTIKRADSGSAVPLITISLQGRAIAPPSDIDQGMCVCLTDGTSFNLSFTDSLVLTVKLASGITVQGVQCGEGITKI
jgi:phage baseplate assembly protein gpV